MTSRDGGAGLLLDTHVALWVLDPADRFNPATRDLLDDPGGPVYVSAVSVAEAAIKASLGKLRLPGDATDLITDTGCEPLDLTADHAGRLAALPLWHRDPFDRMLICQAMAEDLVLVTADRRVLAYADVRLHPVG